MAIYRMSTATKWKKCLPQDHAKTMRKTHIYAMIASRSLAEQPSRRVAIFVPWRTLAVQTCQMLGDLDGGYLGSTGSGKSILLLDPQLPFNHPMLAIEKMPAVQHRSLSVYSFDCWGVANANSHSASMFVSQSRFLFRHHSDLQNAVHHLQQRWRNI